MRNHFCILTVCGYRKKHTLPRSEAAMVAAADLGPITLRLDNYSLTFEDCQWTPGANFLCNFLACEFRHFDCKISLTP